jgi:hypothetical protein
MFYGAKKKEKKKKKFVTDFFSNTAKFAIKKKYCIPFKIISCPKPFFMTIVIA